MQSGAVSSVSTDVAIEHLQTEHVAVPSTPPSLRDVFQSVLETKPYRGGRQAVNRLSEFLRATTAAEQLARWLDLRGESPQLLTRQLVRDLLQRDLALIDDLLTRQVNAIIHHRRFQRIEASWRGLHYLVEQTDPAHPNQVKVKVLNISWKELDRDLDKAVEFDRSQIFDKVYTEAFGMPGGEPFGLLVGDYEIQPGLSETHTIDDMQTLTRMSHVASAAFAPFIAAASPAMLGLEAFGPLGYAQDIGGPLRDRTRYEGWHRFRAQEESRFVGLVMPRVLIRKPHAEVQPRQGFLFRESLQGSNDYLWGNAAYAFAAVAIRSFTTSQWFQRMAGARWDRRGQPQGGLADGLPIYDCETDQAGVAPRFTTDVAITEFQESTLGELGFIPLCVCKNSELLGFFSLPSTIKPLTYSEPAATANAQLSAKLHYILSASRFAHYLKVICRDRVGSFSSAGECEDALYRWITDYVTLSPSSDPAVQAEKPLRGAQVKVVELPSNPGHFECLMWLKPHFQPEHLVAEVRFQTGIRF